MKDKSENETPEAIEQKDVIWGSREKKEKVSVLIGLSRSPSFKPISDMEVGEYEYWLRTNEDIFKTIPKLALELSNFFNQHKFAGEEITYLDFQQLGFKVEHYDEEWCKFKKRTNDGEISGKFYFKTKHLMIANWIDNEGENCYNGTIHSKKFLFEVLISLGCINQQEVFGIGRSYMD
jgi:hypothetical protein